MARFTPARRGFFDDFFDGFAPTGVFGGGSLMKTDVHEKDGEYALDIDMPGFKKEDIKISLYNGNLTVSGEHHESDEEKDAKGNILRQERYAGSCSRSWYVGDAVKESDIHASYKDGTLHIEVPTAEKKQEEEKKIIEIQ